MCAFLAAIQAPTLLIMAQHTLPFNVGDYQKRIKAHQHLTLVKLEGGHHLHIDDNVSGVATTVRQFLQAS